MLRQQKVYLIKENETIYLYDLIMTAMIVFEHDFCE